LPVKVRRVYYSLPGFHVKSVYLNLFEWRGEGVWYSWNILRGAKAVKVCEPLILPLCPDQLWGPPSLLYNGYCWGGGVLSPGVRLGRGVTLTTHPI
jgi:hypothetical protein